MIMTQTIDEFDQRCPPVTAAALKWVDVTASSQRERETGRTPHAYKCVRTMCVGRVRVATNDSFDLLYLLDGLQMTTVSCWSNIQDMGGPQQLCGIMLRPLGGRAWLPLKRSFGIMKTTRVFCELDAKTHCIFYPTAKFSLKRSNGATRPHAREAGACLVSRSWSQNECRLPFKRLRRVWFGTRVCISGWRALERSFEVMRSQTCRLRVGF